MESTRDLDNCRARSVFIFARSGASKPWGQAVTASNVIRCSRYHDCADSCRHFALEGRYKDWCCSPRVFHDGIADLRSLQPFCSDQPRSCSPLGNHSDAKKQSHVRLPCILHLSPAKRNDATGQTYAWISNLRHLTRGSHRPPPIASASITAS